MQAFSGPHNTPKSIKGLITLTALISILSPVLTYALYHFFALSGPQEWLTLSLRGLYSGMFWQPVTYLFIHSMGVGITLSMLVSLFFHMFLLWFAGSEVVNRFGNKRFFFLYFGAGIAGGLLATLWMLLSGSSTLIFGSGPAVYATLVVWAMLYREMELYFLFVIRLKAKWLVLIFLGLALITSLSYGHLAPFLADAAGIGFGLLFGRFALHLRLPFP